MNYIKNIVFTTNLFFQTFNKKKKEEGRTRSAKMHSFQEFGLHKYIIPAEHNNKLRHEIMMI